MNTDNAGPLRPTEATEILTQLAEDSANIRITGKALVEMLQKEIFSHQLYLLLNDGMVEREPAFDDNLSDWTYTIEDASGHSNRYPFATVTENGDSLTVHHVDWIDERRIP